ncbi:MAG TPA: hypothetical protein VG820_06120 [Fimbriimonadaceae bacterium]|nr:hypothetical protein [Fimbriimonadaceae bacterium]
MGGNASSRPSFRPSFEPTLDSILSLLDRPQRERTRLFWAEGCRSFFSALENRWTVRAVVVSPKLLKSGEAWDRLRTIRAPVLRATPDEFAHFTRRAEPDGIGVVCEQRHGPLRGMHLDK